MYTSPFISYPKKLHTSSENFYPLQTKLNWVMTKEIKSQFICAFIRACIYNFMRNFDPSPYGSFLQPIFSLVSYLAPKTLGLEPHLDDFNLYNAAKMFSPTFFATIVSNVTDIRHLLLPLKAQLMCYPYSQSLCSAASASEPNTSPPKEYYCPTIN